MGELKSKVRPVTRRMVLECGGNGRSFFIPQARGNHIESLVPCCCHKLIVAPDKRGAQALAVDKIKAPAASVAQPAIINIVVGPRHQAHNLIHAYIHAYVTADAAVVAHAWCALQLPRARFEAVCCGGERTYRADVDGVERVIVLEPLAGMRS